jgi:hypothetical protein
MPNHVHLILAASLRTPISRVMLCVNSRYTQYFNLRHGRVGHVFQGRFHSQIIEHEAYLLTASRYIHLNPVKAQLCARPQEYPWSSYPAYCGMGNPLRLVDEESVLKMIPAPEAERRKAYQVLVETPFESESWTPIHPKGRGRPKKVPVTFSTKSA